MYEIVKINVTDKTLCSGKMLFCQNCCSADSLHLLLLQSEGTHTENICNILLLQNLFMFQKWHEGNIGIALTAKWKHLWRHLVFIYIYVPKKKKTTVPSKLVINEVGLIRSWKWGKKCRIMKKKTPCLWHCPQHHLHSSLQPCLASELSSVERVDFQKYYIPGSFLFYLVLYLFYPTANISLYDKFIFKLSLKLNVPI